MISYTAATAFVGLVLLWPGQIAHARAISPVSLRWFTISGVFVCISQLFRYLALALAPVSVVAPLQQTATVFRFIFGWMLNRDHEVFDNWVVIGIVVSLIGGLCLTISIEQVLTLMPLPPWIADAFLLHWP